MDPQKTGPNTNSQTMIFKHFLVLSKAPLGHPQRADTERDHPKWMPKSSQGNRTKHSFSEHILLIFLFGIHLVAAPSVPFVLKIIKTNIDFMMFLTPSLSPTWGTKRNIKNTKTSATLHGSAPAKKKQAPRCIGTLSQFGWSRWVQKKRPPQNSPNHLF